jgi:hypothetical protein
MHQDIGFAVFDIAENFLADRKPSIVDLLTGLVELLLLLSVQKLLLLHPFADSPPEFGNLYAVTSQLVGFVAVTEGLLKPFSRQVLLAASGQCLGDFGDEPLSLSASTDGFVADQPKGFIQLPVRQCALSLFEV